MFSIRKMSKLVAAQKLVENLGLKLKLK